MTDFCHIVRESFEQHGLSPEAAQGMAGFVDGVTRFRVAVEMARLFEQLRPTLPGTLLLRVLLDDREPLRQAARRLHLSPAALSKHERKFRALVYGLVKVEA